MVAGVLLIVALDQPQAGATLITISNTFMLGVLWYGVYDFCRHSSIPPYMALGAVWIAHLLPREAGRWLIFHFGPSLGQSVLVIAALVCLLALSVAIMLRASQPKARRFYPMKLNGNRLPQHRHMTSKKPPRIPAARLRTNSSCTYRTKTTCANGAARFRRNLI